MVKYRTNFDKIDALDVIRETEKMIVYQTCWRGNKDERKEAKRSTHQNWFDTWEEAHQFMVEKEQNNVDSLRLRLQRANGKLGQIKGMKERGDV